MDKEEVFRFKKFEVHHGKSSMKVGVDAVLLGSWAGQYANQVLDVGTGCGVIALLLAQRFLNAHITAIDIDLPSVEEASLNFKKSIWRERLNARKLEFPKEISSLGIKFDLIVSNPPYFKSGINVPLTRREKARHQDSLSLFTLIAHSRDLLNEQGRLAIIFPRVFFEEAINAIHDQGMIEKRVCFIRDNVKRTEKRVMMEIGFKETEKEMTKINRLTLFHEGMPTEEYRNLCHEFYLKF